MESVSDHPDSDDEECDCEDGEESMDTFLHSVYDKVRSHMEQQQQWSSNDGTNEVPSSSSSYTSNTDMVDWKVDAPEFVPMKATQKGSLNTLVREVKSNFRQTGEAKTESDQRADKAQKADQKPEKANEMAADSTKKKFKSRAMQTQPNNRTQITQTHMNWNTAPNIGKKKNYQVKGTNTESSLEFWSGPELKTTLLKLDKNDGKILEALSQEKNATEAQAQLEELQHLFVKKVEKMEGKIEQLEVELEKMEDKYNQEHAKLASLKSVMMLHFMKFYTYESSMLTNYSKRCQAIVHNLSVAQKHLTPVSTPTTDECRQNMTLWNKDLSVTQEFQSILDGYLTNFAATLNADNTTMLPEFPLDHQTFYLPRDILSDSYDAVVTALRIERLQTKNLKQYVEQMCQYYQQNQNYYQHYNSWLAQQTAAISANSQPPANLLYNLSKSQVSSANNEPFKTLTQPKVEPIKLNNGLPPNSEQINSTNRLPDNSNYNLSRSQSTIEPKSEPIKSNSSNSNSTKYKFENPKPMNADGLAVQSFNLGQEREKISERVEQLRKRLPFAMALEKVKNDKKSDEYDCGARSLENTALDPTFPTGSSYDLTHLLLNSSTNLSEKTETATSKFTLDLPSSSEKAPIFTNLKLLKEETENDAISQQLKEGGPNFHKLFRSLRMHFPEVGGERLIGALHTARDRRGGKLSGLTKENIVTIIKGILAEPPTESSTSKVAWSKPKRNVFSWKKEDNENLCAICVENIELSQRTTLKCMHAYHSSCIREWVKTNCTCPICRVYVTLDEDFPSL